MSSAPPPPPPQGARIAFLERARIMAYGMGDYALKPRSGCSELYPLRGARIAVVEADPMRARMAFGVQSAGRAADRLRTGCGRAADGALSGIAYSAKRHPCSHYVFCKCLDNGLWSRSGCRALYPPVRFPWNLAFYTVGLSLIRALAKTQSERGWRLARSRRTGCGRAADGLRTGCGL